MGQTALVLKVGGQGALRQHFLDMGVIPGVEVTAAKLAPMGDPLEITIHGYELTLRLADAALIEISDPLPEKKVPDQGQDRPLSPFCRRAQDPVCPGACQGCRFAASARQHADDHFSHSDHAHTHEARPASPDDAAHPGLGEEGKYHDRSLEKPLAQGTKLTFALAGNQNCGKTTLFNQLTGSNQHVGNFPGVTVDRKDGVIRGHDNTLVTDLPGIYSMSPYSQEERVTRQFIMNEKPKGIINIVDATNIERNLLLTTQLIELDIPMVVALNMMDEVRAGGGSIRINELEQLLGVPVVPISAAKNEGIDELIDHLLHVAYFQEKPRRLDFCDENDHGGAVHRAIHSVMHLVSDRAQAAGIPLRFAVTKLIEGDEVVMDHLALDEGEQHEVEGIVQQMEKERGLDRAAAIADMRFAFIHRICQATVVKPRESAEHARSRRADNILTGKYTAIPCFIGIMGLIFYLTFNLVGPIFQDWLDIGISALGQALVGWMSGVGVNPVVCSLVGDAIFGGVGAVVSFLPLIILLFFFLSIVEDCGYMARVAFFMDKLLRKIGLSGRSIVPMLMGFGCSVPAIMATRTLPSSRDRRMTILLIPFMSCSAKMLVYGFFTAAFFPGKGALVMVCLYLLGICLGILNALVLKKSAFSGEAVPFVMELPNYRIPNAKSVGLLVWDKTRDFIQRAFTVIFVATIVIWFLSSFDVLLNYTTDATQSMLAGLGHVVAPIFAPLGLGDWRIVSGLVTGILAKENVVATLSMLAGGPTALTGALDAVTALSLLVFVLLYTPCAAAIATIRQESGTKTAVFVFFYQILVAWIMAFLVRLIGLAILA